MVVEGLRFVLFIEKPPSQVLGEQRKLPARQDLLRVYESGILSEQDWNVGAKVIFITEKGERCLLSARMENRLTSSTFVEMEASENR